jgi:hypothetical protein
VKNKLKKAKALGHDSSSSRRCLPSECDALNLILSTTTKRQRKEKKRKKVIIIESFLLPDNIQSRAKPLFPESSPESPNTSPVVMPFSAPLS